MNSIYWYDYETFGIDPRRDRIAQFGGVRTDEELNIIDEPMVIYCRQSPDYLPDPNACLITGITPQKANAEGLIEREFIEQIREQFARPGTCIAGYNSIRFDDEFTRNTLYRNLFDAYAHEWQNGNSRWDLIDIVRLTRALRPDGIEWPVTDEGRPSNRLELLTAMNGISHEAAHDAMSDVYATIDMARLIREKQPKLFDYMYGLRRKQAVSKQFDLRTRDALIHVSSRYPGDRHSLALVMPICMHPVNKNGIVVYDLAAAPENFIGADADEIAARLYTKKQDLPAGVERVPLKVVHINKCPAVVPLNTLDAASAERLGIDTETQLARRETILEHIDQLVVKTQNVFKQENFTPVTDPDVMIYAGGFFSDDDRSRMERIRATPAVSLDEAGFTFDDDRLPEMLFRYQARNYPESLDDEARSRWDEFCRERMVDPASSPRTLNRYLADIETLQNSDSITGPELVVLEDLFAYGESIKPAD